MKLTSLNVAGIGCTIPLTATLVEDMIVQLYPAIVRMMLVYVCDKLILMPIYNVIVMFLKLGGGLESIYIHVCKMHTGIH